MGNSEPRVSVVVRTRNRPAFLAEALESLAGQTYRDFEAVVVNDGGEPPVIPAEAGFACRVVDTPAPHGRAKALNTGVAAARGHYLAYLDDDDLFLPEHLETLVRFLDGSDQYDAAYTDVEIVEQLLGEDGRYHEKSRRGGFGRDFSAVRLPFTNFIPMISLMHRRSLVERTGPFDETFDLFEDWDFMIRLSMQARVHRIRKITSLYRVRDDGTNAVTNSPWQGPVAQAARRRLFEKHWHLHTPETEMALVDAYERELETAVAWQPRALWAEEQCADKDLLIQRLRNDLVLFRADAARIAQVAGENQSALKDQIAAQARAAAEREAAHAAEVQRLTNDAAEREARLREAMNGLAQSSAAHVASLEKALLEESETLQQVFRSEKEVRDALAAVHASFIWRLMTPYWRFKAWLRR